MQINNKYIPTNVPGYFVDRTTGFIVNMNKTEQDMYKFNISKEQETNELKKEINELKELLQQVLQK
jgi:hypothetical protein